jgi:Raf kinase inhibitor-like YbhB/YbcL family protein
VAEFSLTSTAFAVGGTIPRRHTCDGEDRSPPLSWSAPPAGTGSLALILDDPDAPGGRFIHWLVWGITPDTGGLGEGEAAPTQGRNDFGTAGYRGPCPPRGHGPHRYRFRLHAVGGPSARTRCRRTGAGAGRHSQPPRGCGASRYLSALTRQLAGEPTTNLIAPAQLTILGEDDPGVGQRRDLLGDSSNRRAA